MLQELVDLVEQLNLAEKERRTSVLELTEQLELDDNIVSLKAKTKQKHFVLDIVE